MSSEIENENQLVEIIDLSEYKQQIKELVNAYTQTNQNMIDLILKIKKDKNVSLQVAYHSVESIVNDIKKELNIEKNNALPFQWIQKRQFYNLVDPEYKQYQKQNIRSEYKGYTVPSSPADRQQRESQRLWDVSQNEPQEMREKTPQDFKNEISEQTRREFEETNAIIEATVSFNTITKIKGALLKNLIAEVKNAIERKSNLSNLEINLTTRVEIQNKKVFVLDYELIN